MRHFYAAAAFLGAASASPYANPGSIGDYIHAAAPVKKSTSATQEPCAQISSALAQASDISSVKLDPDVALSCLKSVPLDSQNAPTQVLGLQTMVQFQSTLAYLKNPPAGFLYPAVDIVAGLDKISKSLQSYSNEYDFQLDIYNLISSAYDEHFNFLPDITQILAFARSNSLYSVSADGKALPQVYMDLDIDVLAKKSWNNYTVSPVTKINGQAVETFLENLANTAGGAQDPDTNFNALFPSGPLVWSGQGNPPTFQVANTYEGSSALVTFKNGTTRKITTYAIATKSFSGVTDGASFFRKFCSGSTGSASASAAPSGSIVPSSSALVRRQASSSFLASFSFPSASIFPSASGSLAPSASGPVVSASAAPSGEGTPLLSTQVSYTPVPSQTAVPALQAFPKPWAIAHDASIACFFPEENQDLAVLMLPTFQPLINVEFQDVVRECLATSSKLGKKKLIIDVRGNGGGNVILAYDFFKQLFPSIYPYGTSNFRAFDLFNDLGKVITEHFDSSNPGKETTNNNFGSIFNVDNELNSMNDQFSSWSAFYGPVHTHGDTFTNIVRYNLTDEADTGLPQGLSGFGNLTDIVPKQTFSADNIVMLSDGTCASTCAVFSEFMKTQGKVQSIAIGGRSKYGPMQNVGGVKGANVYGADYLLQIMQEAGQKDATKAEAQQLISKYGNEVEAMAYATSRAYFGTEGHVARVNIRNNIRKGDKTLTPLQFVYEAANCRLFYTPGMVIDQTLVWSTAYSAQWGSGSCVKNSTGAISSKPGTGYVQDGPNGSPSKKGAAGRTTLGFGGMAVGTLAMAMAFFLM